MRSIKTNMRFFKIWQGRQGSNLRMSESKSDALPLGDSPRSLLYKLEKVLNFSQDRYYTAVADFLQPFLPVFGY